MLSETRTTWSAETVVSVAQERFSPIVISTIVIVVGLVPIAFHADRPGMEILGPLVFVILGGLCSSVVASLFLSAPAVLWIWRSGQFLSRRAPVLAD